MKMGFRNSKKVITSTQDIICIWPFRHVTLPRLTLAPFGTPEYEKWEMENWWMIDYSVFMTNKGKAQFLAKELEQAFLRSRKDPAIPCIKRRLRRLRVKYDRYDALGVWKRNAYQISDYCGGLFVREAIMRRLAKYSGAVLEAMCGHCSYFDEVPGRTVVALDLCKESLDRYPFPDRVRIQCNLDQVRDNVQLSFFGTEQFDAVSICFGFKYPQHIGPLMRDFWRILKFNGKLSFIENPNHAYEELCKRRFDETRIQNLLLHCGYRTVEIRALRVPFWKKERGQFYHVEATK